MSFFLAFSWAAPARKNSPVGPGDTRVVEQKVMPEYPQDAIEDGRFGTVRLSVVVHMNGTTEFVRFLRTSGSEDLDHAAAEAVTQWKWRPVRQAADNWGVIEFTFTGSTVTARQVTDEHVSESPVSAVGKNR